MKNLFRALAFVCVLSGFAGTAGAQSATATPVCPLQGQYAFLFEGEQNGIAMGRVGEFTVSSAGEVTAGTQDVNDTTGPSNSTITSGTCVNGSNGLDTLTLTTSKGTVTYMFVATKAGNARMVEFDDGTGSGVRGSGFIRKQDKTAFSLAKLAGTWAFSFSGSLVQQGSAAINRFGVIGKFTVSSKGSIAPSTSVVFLSTSTSGFGCGGCPTNFVSPSSFSAPNTTTGRGTATETYNLFSNGNVTSHFAYYVLTANQVLFLNTDSVATNGKPPFVLGQQLRQQGTFSQASLKGGLVLSVTGWDPLNCNAGGTNIIVGEFTAFGNGYMSGYFDEKDAACSPVYASPTGSGGIYMIQKDGTGSLQFCCSKEWGDPRTYSLVMIRQNTLLLLESLLPTVGVGQMEPQSAGVLTVQGTYNSSSETYPVSAAFAPEGDVTNSVGVETFSNATNGLFLVSAQDASADASPFLQSIFFNGYPNLLYLVPGEVFFNLTSGYIISPQKFVTISCTLCANASLLRFEQPSPR